MKIDTYSWRLQHHRPIYVWLWLTFFAWCLFGPLLFAWKDMGKFILSVQIGFGVLGWLTWSKRGGVIRVKAPYTGGCALERERDCEID